MKDLSGNFRNASGLDKVQFGTKPNDIAGFSYMAELRNAAKTQKKIFSKTEYKVGQIILDLETAIEAEILSKEIIKVRDLN